MSARHITTRMTFADESGGPSLERVSAAGRLEGPLLHMTVQQHYRNTSTQTREVVYTFPLPLASVLLGLKVKLGDKQLIGVVLERRESEARYEEAMADGDTPVLLQKSGDGLFTLNLGNLKAGETAVIEYSYADLLAFDQGKLRAVVPTCIAPRYGDALRDGHLQAQQVPGVALDVDYPLSVSLDVIGELATGELACVTHPVVMQPMERGVRLSIGQGAVMDRDVVFTVCTRVASMAIVAGDVGPAPIPTMVAAAFQPEPQAGEREGLQLKLLLDCSGSMAGDSMAAAREGLQCALYHLQPTDRVSFSRFGSTCCHDTQRMVVGHASNLAVIGAMVAAAQADLGGTELGKALDAVYAVRGARSIDSRASADVLLITDGEVWEIEPLIEAARSSGHRIFAVGVGSAPAESLLRRLAEASGGACEFATPGENIRAAVTRLLKRMLCLPWTDLRIEWGGDTAWAVQPTATAFAGDTVMAFAGFDSSITTDMVRLFARGADGKEREIACAAPHGTPGADTRWARMAASRRLVNAEPDQALALALRYQLVTAQTNLFAVVERADGDKVDDFAVLDQVPHMLAAGWGGTGQVARTRSAQSPMMFAPVSVWRSGGDVSFSLCHLTAQEADTPNVTPGQIVDESAHVSLRTCLSIGIKTLRSDAWAAVGDTLSALPLHADLVTALEELGALGLSRHAAWAVVLRWLATQHGIELPSTAETRLEALLSNVAPDLWIRAIPMLEHHTALLHFKDGLSSRQWAVRSTLGRARDWLLGAQA